MIFCELAEFKKDLKRLLKKYRTLKDDLNVLKMVLELNPKDKPPLSFRLDDLGLEVSVIKVKKIACRALKGKGANSGLRLIYAYIPEETKIIFIELYHKSDKENEDRTRILDNFK